MLSTFTLAYSGDQEDETTLPVEDPVDRCWYWQDCEEYGPNYVPSETAQLDIVFVIDSTGSMHDEIRTVKEELINIMDKINSGQPRPDIRVGVVAYRDYPVYNNGYITISQGLTRDLNEVEDFIEKIEARGGGDYEEAVERGLHEAIHDMKWRLSSHKAILLVGDAPARDTYYQDQTNYGNYPEVTVFDDGVHYYPDAVEYSPEQAPYSYNWKDAIEDAQNKDIRIYTASGSGMNNEGINQWRTIAGKTGGSYIQLIYERRNVIEYYEEENIPVKYIAEARAAPDYEATTDSVMTNNFGFFASKSMIGMAEDAGVDYSGSLDDITGELTREQANTNLFEKFISKIIFWK